MSKPIIVLKVKPKRFDDVSTLSMAVYESMNGNANFVSPQPSLLTLKTATDEMRGAMTAWGTIGHRGSHSDYVDLVGKSQYVYNLLSQLGKWCMTAVDPNLPDLEQEAILTSSGFPLRSTPKSQGFLAMPGHLHRVVAYNLEQEKVKLAWIKPQGVVTYTNINNYVVYRNTVADFFTSTLIAMPSKTSYIDVPGQGTWYYWVAAVNNKGKGVTSEVLEVKVA